MIDSVTIATTGNSTNFGNVTVARRYVTGTSGTVRGVFCSGYSTDYDNTIDYVTIATAGNATDFGDGTISAYGRAGCSDSHGGI